MSNQVFKFIFVGVFSNLINFAVYVGTYWIGATLLVASVSGYSAGLVNSYFFGKSWVFDGEDQSYRRTFLMFLAVYLLGGILMSLVIFFFNDKLNVRYEIAWIFGAATAFLNNFVGCKYMVFSSRHSN